MRTIIRSCALLPLLLLLASGASGLRAGKPGPLGRNGAAVDVKVRVFNTHDRQVIKRYVAELPPAKLPPGLAKRGGALPPGLEKHLRKKGKLPPGLQKRFHVFPADLERRLRPLAPDLRRGFIEGRVIIYNQKTSVVLDIFFPF